MFGRLPTTLRDRSVLGQKPALVDDALAGVVERVLLRRLGRSRRCAPHASAHRRAFSSAEKKGVNGGGGHCYFNTTYLISDHPHNGATMILICTMVAFYDGLPRWFLGSSCLGNSRASVVVVPQRSGASARRSGDSSTSLIGDSHGGATS